LKNILTYLVAFVVPLVMVLITPFCKSTAERRPLKVTDWYLAVDFFLAAAATGIINFFERIREFEQGQLTNKHEIIIILTATPCYFVASFLLLLVFISLHQQYVSSTAGQKSSSAKIVGFGSMIISAAYLYVFAVMKAQGVL